MNKTQNTTSQAQRLIARINTNKATKTKLFPKALDKPLIAARKLAEREGGRNDDGTWEGSDYLLEQIWDNADSALIEINHFRAAVATLNEFRRTGRRPHRRIGPRVDASQNNADIYIERLITYLNWYNGPR